jgi:hypothetical protein
MPLYKQDVHKCAYDILTFTADKVQNNETLPSSIAVYPVATKFAIKNSSNQWVFGNSYNYNYITQTNDALKHSWAIRMG